MHDIIITIGVTFLLLLIIAVILFLWLFWSVGTYTQQDHAELMDRINRLKAEEEELRAKLDGRGLDYISTAPVHDWIDYTWEDFQRDDVKQRKEIMNERRAKN